MFWETGMKIMCLSNYKRLVEHRFTLKLAVSCISSIYLHGSAHCWQRMSKYQEVNSRAVRSLSVQGATGWEGVDMKPADEQTC